MGTFITLATDAPSVFLRELDRLREADRFLTLLAKNREHLRMLPRYGATPYPFVRDLGGAREYLARMHESRDCYEFGIWKRDALAGMAGLDTTGGQAQVYYWVGAEFRGEGLATRAVRTLVRFAHIRLGLEALEGTVRVGNVASEKVLERNRFKFLHSDGYASFYFCESCSWAAE